MSVAVKTGGKRDRTVPAETACASSAADSCACLVECTTTVVRDPVEEMLFGAQTSG